MQGVSSDHQTDPAWRAVEGEFNRALGRNIAQLRRSRDLTQHGLAISLGMTFSRMRQIERGKAAWVVVGEVQKIADALGVAPVSLLPVKESR